MKRASIAAACAVSLASFVQVAVSYAGSPAPDPAGTSVAAGFAHTLGSPSIPDGSEPFIGPDAGLGFTWDIPDTWFQGGEFTFPLSFAPSIPGAGLELVEQPANFYTPTDDEYFSYTFAWWRAGDPDITAAQLSSDFAAYYNGLMEGCTYGQYATTQPCNVANYKAHFTELVDFDPGSRAVKAFTGDVQLYDFFVTGNLITIHMLANTYDCPRDGHRVVLYSASPKPYTDPVWKELLQRQAAFSCE